MPESQNQCSWGPHKMKFVRRRSLRQMKRSILLFGTLSCTSKGPTRGPLLFAMIFLLPGQDLIHFFVMRTTSLVNSKGTAKNKVSVLPQKQSIKRITKLSSYVSLVLASPSSPFRRSEMLAIETQIVWQRATESIVDWQLRICQAPIPLDWVSCSNYDWMKTFKAHLRLCMYVNTLS